jgi:imidazoleglycerol-phosphate dehydratase/histidinol-phosphatase
MKKALFIDRDGTLIVEPEDKQIDSLEKLDFIPGVFRWLGRISREFDYELVLVSNQDGLGTASFPRRDFEPPHFKMLEALAGEGIRFVAEYIDPSLPEENSPNRKPGTGMLQQYLTGEYDLAASWVIGDRDSDLELARNLGSQGLQLLPPEYAGEVSLEQVRNWSEIYERLKADRRQARVSRKTRETEIDLKLQLDGKGESRIDTGLNFFDHMLDQLARHGGMDIDLKVQGDLKVDEHHTVEDTAIVLGQAFREALGDKRDLNRYGFVLPMDESLATVAVDLGGRPYLQWDADFNREYVGDLPTELVEHFFRSFADSARSTLNIRVEGRNEHHKIESIFKGFARTLRQAASLSGEDGILPTTKGLL